jgi:hypothetical protein
MSLLGCVDKVYAVAEQLETIMNLRQPPSTKMILLRL